MDNFLDESDDSFRLLTDKGVFICCLAIIALLFVFYPWL